MVVRIAGEQDPGGTQRAVRIEDGRERLARGREGRLHPTGRDRVPWAQDRADRGEPEPDQPGHEAMFPLETAEPLRVEPVEFAVAPGIPHPALGREEVLAGREHRDTRRTQQDGMHQARAEHIGRGRIPRVVGRTLRDAVEPRHVVVRLGVTQAGGGTRPAGGDMVEQVRRARMAAHVGRQELAERVVPARPGAVIEVAGDVAAETPRLRDQDLAGRTRAEVRLDLAQQGRAEQFGEVEADAVDAEHLGPMRQRLEHQPLEQRGLGAHVVAAAAPVGQAALWVGAEIVVAVDRHQPVGRAEMVEDHVEDDRQAGLMAGPHQVAEFRQRDGARRGGVAVGHAEGRDRHVAPVVFLGGLVLILRAGQELERVDAQAPQVMALPADPGGQFAVTAAHRIRGGQPQQVAQVALDDHQVLDRRRPEAIGRRRQVRGAEHDARGREVLRLRARPRIHDRSLGEPALAGVVGAADRQGVIGPGQVFGHLADPGTLAGGLERDQVVEPGLRPTPAHLDRAGAGGEHPEDGGLRADRRAEGTGRLQHIERVRGEDIAELQFVGLGVDQPDGRRHRIHVRD